MKLLSYSLPVLLFSMACAGGNPTPEPAPDTSRPSLPASSPATARWTITPDLNTHSYTSRMLTTLELQPSPATARDSFSVTLDFSARIEEHADISHITGTVDGWQREPGEKGAQPDVPGLPMTFSGRLLSGSFVLDSIAGRTLGTVPDCKNPILNQVGTLRRNLFVVPPRLATGATWSDSSTVAVCSGTIPVQHTSIRVYTVLGEDGSSGSAAILVQRSERISAVGEGAQGQHRIGIRATGTGSARMLLEPSSGLLRLSESESRTEVIIQSSGREQRFIQGVRERTTRTK